MPDPLPIIPDSSSQKHLSLPHLLLLAVAVAAMIVVLWWSKQSDQTVTQNPGTTTTTTVAQKTFTTPPEPMVTKMTRDEAKAFLKGELTKAQFAAAFGNGTSSKP